MSPGGKDAAKDIYMFIINVRLENSNIWELKGSRSELMEIDFQNEHFRGEEVYEFKRARRSRAINDSTPALSSRRARSITVCGSSCAKSS